MRFWILLSTWLVASGWILSAAHMLNRTGYLVLAGLTGGFLMWFRRNSPRANSRSLYQESLKLERRLRQPLPGLYFALLFISLAAGLLYCPYNGDSDAYRIPRVFQWLGQEQWHWIHTADARMNTAGTGFEWLSAPLMLFTGRDGCMFLANWVSFLLLPGLVFSLFVRLGVRPRVAWWWMWLVSTGWCYAWQAQSTNNDSFAVIYALASVDLALRARQSGRLGDWWLALLAAALLTGAKQTSIPLALVPFIALVPGFRPMMTRPLATLFVLAVSMLVSAIPISILNLQHAGSWLGTLASDPIWGKSVLPSPFWGVIGNAFCLAVQNLSPPIFPFADSWNASMQRFVETPFGSHFRSFEFFGFLDHAVNNGSAGLGLFVGLLFLISTAWVLARRSEGAGETGAPPDKLVRLLRLSPWLALLVFMAKVGAYQNARQLAPYYAFLFPIFLVLPGYARLARQRWWRSLAVTLSAATVLMIFCSRTCPLFPAQTVFGWLHAKYPQSQALDHLLVSFSSHNTAIIQRQAFSAYLPGEEKVLGYYTGYTGIFGGLEPGYWQPFGIRRVERIVPGDSLASVRARGIHYVIAEIDEKKQSLNDWLLEYDAELIAHVAVTIQYGSPLEDMYLVRVRPLKTGSPEAPPSGT